MARVGYARVSTRGQSVDAQVTALRRAGCQTIFKETASGGRKSKRPVFEAVLEHLTEGDILVVTRLDRLGRSLPHLIATVQGMADRGVRFHSLHESIDTSSSAGRLLFHFFGALAEFERDLISERTKAGLDAARERGAKPGRKPVLTAEQIETCKAMHASREFTMVEIAKTVGASRTTVYRALDLSH